MEPEEDTIETFVHPAIQYIESEFGYKSLQGTYSDEFYINMDIEEAIPEGRIYFAYMNFALALNDKAEYQIGEKVYKYLSKYEILEVSNIDDALLQNIRTHGFYPDSRAGSNCGDVCESFVQSNTLSITVKNDCPQRQLQKTDNITFSNAGKDYKLQGWLGVETFANFRARAYSDCRFYRKKNGNWKPYKPDGKLGTKLIINRFNYKIFYSGLGTSTCGNKLNWSSGNINMKHQKDVSENWNSPWQFPGFNNDNYFAATDIVNPTSLTGEYKVIQNGTTQNLNISYIIY